MFASVAGRREVVQVLLDKGAEVNAKDESGQTASILASWKGHGEEVDLLKRAEAKA